MGCSCCRGRSAAPCRSSISIAKPPVPKLASSTGDWNGGDGIRLITDLRQERDVTRLNQDLTTRSWSVKDPSQNTDLLVSRRDNRLVMRGIFKGKTLAKTVAISASPWYQALSISLRPFTNPNNTGLAFWSIRPDTLDVYKLEVIPLGEEQITIAGQRTDAIKLKIQLPGFKAMFWSCHYWLRQADGVFIRYEGPSGPPGWPATMVELIDDQGRVNGTESANSAASGGYLSGRLSQEAASSGEGNSVMPPVKSSRIWQDCQVFFLG